MRPSSKAVAIVGVACALAVSGCTLFVETVGRSNRVHILGLDTARDTRVSPGDYTILRPAPEAGTDIREGTRYQISIDGEPSRIVQVPKGQRLIIRQYLDGRVIARWYREPQTRYRLLGRFIRHQRLADAEWQRRALDDAEGFGGDFE